MAFWKKLPSAFAFLVSWIACGPLAAFTLDPRLPFSPNEVSYLGRTTFEIRGEDFTSTMRVTIGGTVLSGNQLTITGRGTLLRGLVPPTAIGAQNVLVEDARTGQRVTINGAFTSIGPLSLASMEPGTVGSAGSTKTVITGVGFTPETLLSAYLTAPAAAVPFEELRFVDARTFLVSVPEGLPVGNYTVVATDFNRQTPVAAEASLLQVVSIVVPKLRGVDPLLLPSAGGTPMAIRGTDLLDSYHYRVGGMPLTDVVVSPDGSSATGKSPALALGLHTFDVFEPGDGIVLTTFKEQVEVALPADITSVAPTSVQVDGSTLITIRGLNFRPETVFTVGAHVLQVQSQSSTQARGPAPALVAGEPTGLKDVVAEDARGRDVLVGGVNYLVPTDPCVLPRLITKVMPSLVSTAGGAEVEVHGLGFAATDTLRVGDKPVVQQQFVQPGGGAPPYFRATLPPYTPGKYTVFLNCTADIRVAELVQAVEYAPPPALKRIVPNQVSMQGGDFVVVEGTNLRAETIVLLGDAALVEPTLTANGASISGYAPPYRHPAGGRPTEPVPVDVTVMDSRGADILRAGLRYLPQPLLIPGPEEMETSLAEDTARFSWHNPAAYDQIEVLGEDDQVLQVLAGDATFLELPAFGQQEVRVRFEGRYAAARSEGVRAIAMLHECERPAPLMWGGEPCNYTPQNSEESVPFCARVISLDGDHAAANLIRCDAGGGGGEAGGGGSAAPYVPRDLGRRLGHGGHGGRGGHGSGGGSGGQRGGGGALPPTNIGYIQQNEAITDVAVLHRIQGLGNQLVTGFILEQPADKLEIAGYYEKLATAFGLELRGRLVHVYPEDGFRDELTFPDVPIHAGRQLNSITYFRANKDIGHPGHPDDPNNLPPESCQLPIPAGEYRLELYAVGGNHKVQYYTFATDQHDNEILIKDVPCPPYPLVKITDLTGLRTLPDITNIEAELPVYGDGIQIVYQCNGIRVKFEAQGFWLDENNASHSVPPIAPSDNNPHFEYKWTVHDRVNPTSKITASSPFMNYCVPDWGCYKVTVEVRDKQCGFTKTRTYEVPVIPRPEDVPCPNTPFTFLFPTPDPGGMYGVVGLKIGDPNGAFEGKRPVSFRVLVSPQCYCAETQPCAAGCSLQIDENCPVNQQIEFRLAWKNGANYQAVSGVDIQVKDLCPNVTDGAKYFAVDIEDLGEIPPQNQWLQKTVYPVFFQGRKWSSNPNAGWRNVGETADPLRALQLFNRPESLNGSYWNGHFVEGDQSYHFVAQSSKSGESNAPIGPSKPLDLGLPAVDVGVPSYDNDISSGFTSRFMMLNGVWGPEVGAGSTSGELVSNKMDGAPVEVEPSVVGGGGGDGGGGSLDIYEWCRGDEIFNESISQTLFESIIYTGTIWIIPVTIWGRVGLGLDILIASHALIRLSPFGNLADGHYAQAEFSLDSKVQLSIPCEISCDILGGVLSIAMRLVPKATFLMKTNIGTLDTSPHVNFFAECFIDLVMVIEGCLNLLITEACINFEIPILDHEVLISTAPENPCFAIPTCDDDDVDVIPCDGGGGAAANDKLGSGGGGLVIQLPYQTVSAPVTTFSPNKQSLMEMTFDNLGLTTIDINGQPAESLFFGTQVGDLLNPTAAFVSNSAILIAWTTNYCSESGLSQYCSPDPDNPPPPATLTQNNLLQAQQEVVLSTVSFKVKAPFVVPRWIVEERFRISDPAAEVPNPSDRRVDGMAALAADLSVMQDNPPGGQAIVAWVRYDGDFLKLDGQKTIYQPHEGGDRTPCSRRDPTDPPKDCKFDEVTVDNIRPQMEATAIYVRRISINGLVSGEDKLKISPPGINVEPTIALSPSGQVGYCVWVHDSTVDPVTNKPHVDLTETNKGRQLLYAVYSKSTNQWSAAASVLANVADYDDKYPGVLEPHLALKNDSNGLLAFTAVSNDAPVNDSGLGGNRFVYGCRLENGVWGVPFLIHGRCLRRVFGWRPQVVIDIPELIDPLSQLHIPLPEEVMIFQQTGQTGLIEGSGNVTIAPVMAGLDEAAPAQGLFTDGNVHSNVTGALANGMLCTVNLNSGNALFGIGGGGQGGGVPEPRRFESLVTRLEPDLAVVGCRLSDQFPAPGSRVTAFVEVENLGLAGTPLDNSRQSVVGLQAVFIDAAGRERVVASDFVPTLMPGEATQVPLNLAMPHEPVRVRVQLHPNPIDSNVANNSRECAFGAPAPRELRCLEIVIDGEVQRPAKQLTWKNAGLYNEILLYRDGSMFASLPGASTMFIDLYAPATTQEYCVRGRMGASKSTKAVTRCEVAGVRFRRGLVNNDDQGDISDAITILGYLFLGNPSRLSCQKAADTNDDNKVDLSDAVAYLSYRFLGGRPPAEPFAACGLDPTADELTCEHGAGCE